MLFLSVYPATEELRRSHEEVRRDSLRDAVDLRAEYDGDDMGSMKFSRHPAGGGSRDCC